MNDDDAPDDATSPSSDVTLNATLREEHQDLGAAVQAWKSVPSPTCCRSPASSAASWP
jgi:hypothetical protein